MVDPKQQTSPFSATAPRAAPLAGQTILVTGANRGIGRAMAEAFVRAGAGVIVHARTGAATLCGEIGARAGVDGDLRDPSLPARLAASVGELGGDGGPGLDLLVLNAAVLGPMGPMDALERGAFAEVMAINVEAQFAIFQALLPALLAARGSAAGAGRDHAGAVIWLSSALGRFAVPGYGAYCASKHAVEGLSRLAHAEYAGRGLVSVTVAPGMVQTEMLKAALGTDDVSQHTEPALVGAAFARLAAALSPSLSGQALEISDF